MRLWSFTKPIITKNTTKFRGNTFGFYAFNGCGVVDTYPNSKQESVMDFLGETRLRNPFNHIVMILDIELIFLPPYSPQLNPIELIWKSIKRVVSRAFVKDEEMMVETVKTNFIELSRRKTFCENWMEVVVG